jgi:hypothetical protein
LTYLECVNRVLRRLRENEVTTVNETPYSKLIGDLVNVVKTEIEDSWDWSALRTTLTAVTTPTLFNYVLVGSGTRLRVIDIFNDTDNFIIEQRGTKWFDVIYLTYDQPTGSPIYYNFNGVDVNGDSQVDFFPIPDRRTAPQIDPKGRFNLFAISFPESLPCHLKRKSFSS